MFRRRIRRTGQQANLPQPDLAPGTAHLPGIGVRRPGGQCDIPLAGPGGLTQEIFGSSVPQPDESHTEDDA